MMKRYYLLILVFVIPVFAGQVVTELANPVSEAKIIKTLPVPFAASRGETLKYDTGIITNGIYLGGGPFDPPDYLTYGWATHFILSDFGITTSRKAISLMYAFYSGTVPTFRLYLWRNVPAEVLRPWSHYTDFPYCSLTVPLPPDGVWGSMDISGLNIILPETLWVGVTYNEITPTGSWSIGIDESVFDQHTYINLSGGPTAWQVVSTYPNAYCLRIVVAEIALDAGPISIDIASEVPVDTNFNPQATVKNMGTSSATNIDVNCVINDAGTYSSTYQVASLAPGAEEQVTFPDDFTFAVGSYTVTVSTDLSGDENPANDTLQKDVITIGIAEDNVDMPLRLMFDAPTIVSQGRTNVEFSLPQATEILLLVYDACGRLCQTLVSERFSPGTHTMSVNLDLPAGVYFYNLKTESEVINKKFLVMR